MKLIGIVGTNSQRSTNRKLLQYIETHFAAEAEIELIEIKDFPIFNPSYASEVPAIVNQVAAKIAAADGVIFATPEYDHTITASLMNALEWLSASIRPFQGKPVMIVGASFGMQGSNRAQWHLRQVLNAPDLSPVVLTDEFMLSGSLQAFDNDGELVDAAKVKQLEEQFASFKALINEN